MLESILAPLAPADFFRDYWTKKFVHVPGPSDKFAHFFPWEVLNKALEEHRFDSERLKLFRAGQKIESERYLNGHWVDGGRLANELSNGATLIFNGCEAVHRPLRDLCAHLEGLFHHRVIVNLYAGWRRDNGFDVHWDDQDTMILQVAGRKRWKVWEPTRLNPLKEDVADTSVPQACEPVWDQILEPGGLLSVPRGWWHVVYPLDEPCLHLTVTIQNHTGIDLLHWLADRIKSSETGRMAIPIMAAASEREKWLSQLREDLLGAWDDKLLDSFLAEMDSKAMPRPRISLPEDAGRSKNPLQKTTRLKLAIPRQLQFSSQDGKTFCHAAGMRWQMDADIAQRLRTFNDRQPHSISEISPAADIRLSAVTGILLMAGVLRRTEESLG